MEEREFIMYAFFVFRVVCEMNSILIIMIINNGNTKKAREKELLDENVENVLKLAI